MLEQDRVLESAVQTTGVVIHRVRSLLLRRSHSMEVLISKYRNLRSKANKHKATMGDNVLPTTGRSKLRCVIQIVTFAFVPHPSARRLFRLPTRLYTNWALQFVVIQCSISSSAYTSCLHSIAPRDKTQNIRLLGLTFFYSGLRGPACLYGSGAIKSGVEVSAACLTNRG